MAYSILGLIETVVVSCSINFTASSGGQLMAYQLLCAAECNYHFRVRSWIYVIQRAVLLWLYMADTARTHGCFQPRQRHGDYCRPCLDIWFPTLVTVSMHANRCFWTANVSITSATIDGPICSQRQYHFKGLGLVVLNFAITVNVRQTSLLYYGLE